jgi:hypothetical protein
MEERMSEEVVKREPKVPMMMGAQGFEFSLDGAIRFAQGLVDSGMAPKGITHPGAVVALIEAGKELGLAPMYALANLTFTNGRLGIMGDAAKALIRNAGVLEPGTDFDVEYAGAQNTAQRKCTVSAHRKGQPAPFSASFTIAEAVTAGLAKVETSRVRAVGKGGVANDYGPWATYTDRMLMYRALGFLCRDRFSDVLAGCVLKEELDDYPAEAVPRSLAPPPEPDPLLASIVDAEIVVPPPVKQVRDFKAEIAAVKQKLRETNTQAGVATVRKNASELLADLDKEPADLRDDLLLAMEARLADLEAR